MSDPSQSDVSSAASETYTRLVAIKRLLPSWLLYRLDPYNVEADRFVARAAREAKPGAVVLDAGAGECRHRELFAHARYVGTDSGVGDPDAWDYTQLSFFSDLVALPVGDASADVVLSVNVLEHVPDPAAVLGECARVLRSGARLYVVAPQSWQLHQAPADYQRFTRYGLLHLLEGAGLRVEEIEPVGGTFWNFGTRSLYLLTHFKGWKLPFGLLAAPLLGFLVPLVCFYLDRLDRSKGDTLGHRAIAIRP